MASIDRTAYPRFRGTVTARELVESFTPTVDEVGWARGKTTADQTFLVLVIWLKCYQRMRYFLAWTRFPTRWPVTYAPRWDCRTVWRSGWKRCGRLRGIATTCASAWG